MATFDLDQTRIAALRGRLLAWYEQNARDLPWRKTADPYAIWVSEVMLQQTRVAVVVDRYKKFMARFPTLVALALGDEQRVLALWSGLGYYRRARMLQKAAQFVAQNMGGNLPARASELRLLPGIGAYTAAAVASIAHGEPVAVVDGNVERVLCRLAGWAAGSRKGGGAALRRKIEKLSERLLDPSRPGDFNQAMMELGATLCAPRNPQCAACPLAEDCKTRGEHKMPQRAPMRSREVAYALSVRIGTGKGPGPSSREVLLDQRPAQATVMPGMWELPALADCEVPPDELRMTLRHSIMQVNYYVRIRTVFEDDAEALTVKGGERRWIPLREAGDTALTGLARKVLVRARLLEAAVPDSVASGTGEP
jgi:A/G-specific adenine glycosylase